MKTSESLKLRIERVKQLGNLRFNQLKCLYKGHSIGERYAQGRLNAHVHVNCRGRGTCGGFSFRGDRKQLVMLDHDQINVFVLIADLAQGFRPLATVVRLQAFDHCGMARAEPIEKTARATGVPFERFWRQFDRELIALASHTRGIEHSKPMDQVVQAGPDAVRKVTSEDCASRRHGLVPGVVDAEDFSYLAGYYCACRLHLDDRSLSLSIADFSGHGLQFREVFTGPAEPAVRCV